MWIQPPEVILILLFKCGTADGNLHIWVHIQRKNTEDDSEISITDHKEPSIHSPE